MLKTPKSTEILHVVCLGHLFICFSFISVCSGSSVSMGGVMLSPILQWAYGSFSALCIISIIAAGVGNIYQIAVHIDMYYYVLGASAALDIFWIVIFVVFGHSCETVRPGRQPTAPRLMTVVSCAVNSVTVLVALMILIAFKVFGMHTATHAAVESRLKQQQELLPYLNKPPGTGRLRSPQPSAMPSLAAVDAAPPDVSMAAGAHFPGGRCAPPPPVFHSAPPPPPRPLSQTSGLSIPPPPPRTSDQATTMVPNSSSSGPVMTSYGNYGSTETGQDSSSLSDSRKASSKPPASVPRLALQSCGSARSARRSPYGSAVFGAGTPDSSVTSNAAELEDNAPRDPLPAL